MPQNYFPPPTFAHSYLFEDARRRDMVTARRALLLEFLWRERYLTRDGLHRRVTAILGADCFGVTEWWRDVFSRDMRVVKAAFGAAGYELAYSRRPERPGYYLKNQPALAAEVTKMIHSCATEVDAEQISIFSRMTPAQRFRLGASVSEAARDAVRAREQTRVRTSSQSEAGRTAR